MKTYYLNGIATVSVFAQVEASSKEEALAKVTSFDWECDEVDGEVSDISIREAQEIYP
jgi:hypothetical protein